MPPTWVARFFARPARPAPAAELFAPDFLNALENLRLVALKALGGGLREGHRLGAYKGGQLEFHGHRAYSPGDELRYLDWNSYARLGRPFVKEFAREEAGVLHLLLDATASMSLEGGKWLFARRAAALFSHVALASRDLVRLYVFRGIPAGPGASGRLEQFPPAATSGRIREYLQFLSRCRVDLPVEERSGAAGPDALGAAVTSFLRTGPKRGRVIVISDFWQLEQELAGAVNRLAGAGFEPCGLHVLADSEILPAAAGELLVRAPEESDEVELTASAELLARYGQELERHRQAVQDAFVRRGGNYIFASTDTSIERVLLAALRQRRWVT